MKRQFEDQKTHPSFGMASFSRVSGGNGTLFGSAFNHSTYMALSISRGRLSRDLSRDWYFPGEELIEIAMSEAQFCQLVSSPNMGSGVPVTISRFQGEGIEAPPIEIMREKFSTELKEQVKGIGDGLTEVTKELAAAIESGSIGKTNLRDILKRLGHVEMELKSNLPFVQTQFEEAMENTVAAARVEIEATVMATVTRAGLNAIGVASPEPIRMIESPNGTRK